jgi:hypothetical protein
MSDLLQVKESFEAYKYAFEQGQISADEYKSLLEGLEIEKAVTMNAEELQFKEHLHTAISAAISAASMLG